MNGTLYKSLYFDGIIGFLLSVAFYDKHGECNYSENMDTYINGEGIERSKKKAAETFIKTADSSMEDVKIRAMIKDAMTYGLMDTKTDGYIYDKYSGQKLGARPSEILQFLKNPKNDETLQRFLEEIEELWSNEN